VHGHYWTDLAGPLFVAGGAIFAFIPTAARGHGTRPRRLTRGRKA
jgi:hypothetical protein